MSASENIDTLLSEIRARRETNVAQAEQLLALTAVETDTENRLASLRMAARHLADDTICANWCASIPGEKDPAVHLAKLSRLAQHLAGPTAKPAHFQAASPLVPVLLAASADATLQHTALRLLALLIDHTPEAGAAMVSAYSQTQDRYLRNAIIATLSPLRHSWGGLAPFLKTIVADLDSNLQPAIVSFLLSRNTLEHSEQLALLVPGSHAATRQTILAYWGDIASSSTAAQAEKTGETLLTILRTDPSRTVRAEAFRLIELRADLLSPQSCENTLLEIMREDTEPIFRDAAARALAYAAGAHPSVANKLLSSLATEKDTENFSRILNLVAPHASSATAEGEKIRSTLVAFLDGNIQSSLAAHIIETLKSSIVRNPGIAASLMARFNENRDDHVSAALLETLALQSPDIPDLAEIFAQAATSRSVAIRSSALLGLAGLPLVPAHIPQLLSAIVLLNDEAIPRETRLRYALKLSHIPPASLPAESQSALKPIIAGLPAGGDSRKALEALLARAAALQTAKADTSTAIEKPDFATWRQRLHAEKRTDGMLPALYLAYDAYPDESAALLKDIVKTPGHRAERHNNDFHRDTTILDFLRSRGAIDDEMSQFCANHLLGKDDRWGSLDFYLALLKSNPAWPRLWETLWEILDRDYTGTPPDPVLLRELLYMAVPHDKDASISGQTDTIVAREFIHRAQQKDNPRSLAPYLRFLEKNDHWSEAIPVIKELESKLPAALLADDKTQKLLGKIYEQQGEPRKPATPAQPPPARTEGGLLDE